MTDQVQAIAEAAVTAYWKAIREVEPDPVNHSAWLTESGARGEP